MNANEKLKTMLNGSEKFVGSKQVLKGISEGTIRCVFVAEDADSEVKTKLVAAAETAGVEIEFVPSKVRLGEYAGIEVGAAVVGIVKLEAQTK